MAAGCFGLDQWRTVLQENYEANRQREIEIEQEKAELSESLFFFVFFFLTYKLISKFINFAFLL